LEDEYNDLVQSWEKLNSAVAKRKKALEHSYKVQVYLEECRTAVAFLKTRNELMTQYKITDSLSGLEETLRNHERTHQEVKCYAAKINHFGERAEEIDDQKCSETNESLQAMFSDVMSSFAEHEDDLRDALRKAKFEDNSSKMINWGSNMIEMIQNRSLPENAAQAEASIQEHTRRKGEIDSNEEKIEKLVTEGEEIEANDKCEALKTCLNDLKKSWNDKQEVYLESVNYFKFMDEVNEKVDWLKQTKSDLE